MHHAIARPKTTPTITVLLCIVPPLDEKWERPITAVMVSYGHDKVKRKGERDSELECGEVVQKHGRQNEKVDGGFCVDHMGAGANGNGGPEGDAGV